ncbi:hypothetical protein Lesp02_04710 [Lentzea sp. NBRC 105346]|uniref:AfsR/SARP family transcriptional regulator n=1 Tax=Lentzea sp. NBRC 105346 TaxID=3032205 RepID=UPI0024A0194E|nr:BTAD domain-containing putative transcriptional regulator [Lentzea sp. NBRC 105346]GLZ28281.1 hypothetical protein Lesp02_04710 [Lentzea sp. NBRC 105346]
MEFALLGPVEAGVGLGPLRQRAVLVAVLLDAPVPVDRLAERVWGPAVPRSARRTLFSYLSRLKSAGVPIERRPAGYVVEPSTVDVDRFRELMRDKRYDEALALWRGEPFAELDSPWFTEVRAALIAERDAAEFEQVESALSNGVRIDLAGLAGRCARRPLDERLAAQYVLALHRAGRTADALAHYDRTRRVLLDELGVEPGPLLRRRHLEVLEAVPRQLPARPRSFAARQEDLAKIQVGAITVISGPGGVGKTWLALQWARPHPDGELYADLRGFDPAREPVRPEVALRGFLRALGVGEPPADLDDQVALYRTLTASKRMLVLLDNARDAEQVTPLLPAGPSTVLITSRHRLHGLVTGHGARPVPLDVLDEAGSRLVLRAHLPGAPDELVELCGGLPLALGIAAARAHAVPDLVQELREDRLGALDGGDLTASLRAVFSWSLRALDTTTAEVFALLGRTPGPDAGTAAVAAMAGRPVRADLRRLEDAHLVEQHLPGRYRMHDLVRLHAAEQPADPEAARRLVRYYLGTAFAADRVIYTYRSPIDVTPGTAPDEPLSWFAAEHACLRAAQRMALDHGWDDEVWRLAWVLDGYHVQRGLLLDLRAMWSDGLPAARRCGSRLGQFVAHRMLGIVHGQLGDYDTAHHHLAQARGFAAGVQHAHVDMATARVLSFQEDWQPALDLARRSLDVYETLDNDLWQALGHTAVGWFATRLGARDATHFERALALFRKHDDSSGEADNLANLGHLHALAGRADTAIAHYERALELLRATDLAYDEAVVLEQYGEALEILGRDATAVRSQAAALFRSQNRMHKVRELR